MKKMENCLKSFLNILTIHGSMADPSKQNCGIIQKVLLQMLIISNRLVINFTLPIMHANL